MENILQHSWDIEFVQHPFCSPQVLHLQDARTRQLVVSHQQGQNVSQTLLDPFNLSSLLYNSNKCHER